MPSTIDTTATLSGTTLTLTMTLDPSLGMPVSSYDIDFTFTTTSATYVANSLTGPDPNAFAVSANDTMAASGDLQLGAQSLGSTTLTTGQTLLSVQFTVTGTPSTFPIMFNAGDFNFNFYPGDSGTTNVAVTQPCFVAGTRILTDRGNVVVEDLRVGDRVAVDSERGFAEICWIGHRAVDCGAPHARLESILPVRVERDAMAEGVPARDVRLSPDHAVFIDGVLIPVQCLINGVTVRQENAERITYWHVELDQHDIMFADGLRVESYLDTGNRAAFANGGRVVMAHPNFAARVWTAEACAPLVCAGELVDRVRDGLRARAGLWAQRAA